MALDATAWSQLVIVVLQVALVVLLLVYGGHRRENRALAFVLTARSGVFLMPPLAAIAPALEAAASQARPYYDIAYVLGQLFLAVVFIDRAPTPRRRRGTFLAALVVITAYEAYYFFDHGAYVARSTPAWRVMFGFVSLSYALLGILLLRVASRDRAEAPLLAGTAFVLIALYDRITVLPANIRTAQGAAWLDAIGPFFGLALFVAFIVLLALGSRGTTTFSRLARRSLVLTLICAATGLVALMLGDAQTRAVGSTAWDLALPLLVGYAILRHDLFGLDVKVRWTIQRGTLAVAFVGAFFVGSQLAQNWLSARYGVLLGGVTAGLLLFGLAPLQRLAERVASAAVPQAQPYLAGDRKLAALRKAAQNATRDGRVTREEEKHLYDLAAEMGIDAATAHQVILDAERSGSS